MSDTRDETGTTREALDKLAELFLTPELRRAEDRGRAVEPGVAENGVAGAAGAGGAATVEAVLLGHLPGFASPWVTQYAHALGQRRGSDVAVVYPTERTAKVELVRHDEQIEAPAAQRLRSATLEQAVAELGDRVGAWLVVVAEPHGTAPAAAEGAGGADGRAVLEQLERWTLISGADEASIVGAYRLLKSLHGLATQRTEGPARISVAFGGCDEEQAADAMGRLSQAAATHLGLGLQLALVRRRIEPTRRHPVGEFAAAGDAARRIVRAVEAAETATAEVGAAEMDLLRGEGGSGTAAAWQPGGTEREQADLGPGTNAAAASASVGAQGPGAAADRPGNPIREKGLWRYLGGGAVGLAARCPRCAEVELAVDEDGRLHLLRQVADEEAASADAALRELTEARAWSREHAAVLGLTRSGVTVDPGLEPRLHLFTAEPAPLLRRLLHVAAGGAWATVVLHLLRHVEEGRAVREVHAVLT